MKTVTNSLFFSVNCEELFSLAEQLLGSKETGLVLEVSYTSFIEN